MSQTTTIFSVVKQLSQYDTFEQIYHRHRHGEPFPSSDALHQIIDITRSVLFPGYFGNPSVDADTIHYHIGVNLEKLSEILCEQVLSGICFGECEKEGKLSEKQQKACEITSTFISSLPRMRKVLITDIETAYYGDPAAKSFAEIILCYPAIKAISNYRIAHELLTLGVPLIPRMISEMAHSETGIDIHPGATIGSYFTIDHGTGVVIGETTVIGDHVKLYQGVTLGAKSFELDESGNPVKNIPRHPIIEDNVIIYSNASILGRITIGEGAVIGGNIWVTTDVAKGEKVVQRRF
ncbi:MAG: serine acetyltransferase [Prevotellaceae bacterium]|jgi:serine O-acetyltransferase|nr:serine acetyltransferase [Prevotellaceae bacterium]